MRQYSTNEMTPAGQRRITVVGVDLDKTWIEVCGQGTDNLTPMVQQKFVVRNQATAIVHCPKASVLSSL